MKMTLPEVTIICPIYNEEKFIGKCIESLLQQDYPSEKIEIILIDGQSKDKTREVVASYSKQYPQVQLLDNPHKTVPYALNIGIRASKGEYIVRVDGHSQYPAHYVSTLIHKHIELSAGNVGARFKTLPANGSNKALAIALALSHPFGVGNAGFRIQDQGVVETDTVPYGCFKRSLFDEIGFFDEELTRNQDDEFNARIIESGKKIYLISDLAIDYVARGTIAKTYKMYYQYGLFKPLVNKKLSKPATLRQFVPLLFVAFLIGVLPFVWMHLAILEIYVFFLSLYLVLSILVSVRMALSHKNVHLAYLLPFVFFAVHFAYGIGYFNGIVHLLTGRKIQVDISR